MTLQPIYISRSVINASDILHWFKNQGISNIVDDNDLHVTVVYSRNPVDMNTLILDTNNITIDPNDSIFKMDLFDENQCLVMVYHNNFMQERFNYFKQKQCSWDFPEYNCHITITNNFHQSNIKLTDLKAFPEKIILGPEILEPLNVEYENNTAFGM